MTPTGEFLGSIITIVPFDAPIENILRGKIHQLSKYHLPLVHWLVLIQGKGKLNSNRRRHKIFCNIELSSFSKNLNKS
jgi:hypothetical protein